MKNLEAEKLVAYLMATFPNWKPADVVADIWKNEFLPYEYETAQPVVAAICRSEVHFMPPLGVFLTAIRDAQESHDRIEATRKYLTDMKSGDNMTQEEKHELIGKLLEELDVKVKKF